MHYPDFDSKADGKQRAMLGAESIFIRYFRTMLHKHNVNH